MSNTLEFSLLKQAQSYVIKYANVISEVLNIDIEIVDEHLLRVAGTGVYRNEINKYCEGRSYRQALESGEHKIILNPVLDICCKDCNLNNSCKEVLEIATPIFYNDRIIGVIGLVCFNNEQRSIIIKNLEENVRFLDNIAELISSKVYEEFGIKKQDEFFSIFDKLIKSINTPIIILGENNEIYNLNESALKKLTLEENISDINSKELGNQIFPIEKYKTDGINIFINFGRYKKLFIFHDTKNKISKLTSTSRAKSLSKPDSMIGNSKSIRDIKVKVEKIANSNSTVLITGESGTGKEVLAKAIHEASNRRDKPLITINCAAIPEHLLESELLGYAKGAFSGANSQGRVGKFELANTGIIFLDEIGDMPLNLQAKILRVIQDRRCIRIGSNKIVNLDIRIIAATNKDLKKLVEEKKFREDLYYRLNVIPIKLPPLRERKNDVDLLMNFFIDKYNNELNLKKKELSDEALNKIKNYNWPGNIRELENCIEYMINISGDEEKIEEDSLPDSIRYYNEQKVVNKFLDDELTLEQLEKSYINFMVDKYGFDLKGKKIVADKLGIGIATLYRKIDKNKIGKVK